MSNVWVQHVQYKCKLIIIITGIKKWRKSRDGSKKKQSKESSSDGKLDIQYYIVI